MSNDLLTILEGSTFCVSEPDGGIRGGLSGVYADDTRFLSRFELIVDDRPPLLLGSARVEYFNAAHYLRNTASPTLPRDTLSIARERFIGRGLAERLRVRNEAAEPIRCTVRLELEADFVDVITLKGHEFAVEAGEDAAPLPPAERPAIRGPRELVIDDAASELVTWILTSRDVPDDGSLTYGVELEAGEEWQLVLEVIPGHKDSEPGSCDVETRFGREMRHVRRSLDAWGLSVPVLHGTERRIEEVYRRSIADLASLRLRGFGSHGAIPAAGAPWFMTIFGRDTLITCLQTMLFGPELSIGALGALASLQAAGDHAAIDAEPGKIPHEVRRGKAAAAWFPVYYGSVDATPLFLILLSEVCRWTGSVDLARELEQPARRALAWIDEFGDRDGDGFVEYERRTQRGLENQSWKDSGDSQRFRDGAIARPPIAPAEVQGYVFDAKSRLAELARDAWDDHALADRLETDARRLAVAFDATFWMDDRQAYALALDHEKRQVDALCSNIGHLLWSGIVPPERVAALAGHLTTPPLWSGWGVRTMAADELAYNPISYHNGTVWPHDTSIAAWGLARNGMLDECRLLCAGVLDAAESFSGSLPEAFAGYDRAETPFAVDYPTACRPQAWAAGAPILCLRLLLGLQPDAAEDALVSIVGDAPDWLGDLTLTGIHARGQEWDVAVSGGLIRVDARQ